MSRYIIIVAAMAGVTLLTRAAPFIFFSKRKLPATLVFLQARLPPALMTILVLSAFKDIDWSDPIRGVPALAGIAITAMAHLWRRNVLVSIACGTASYMMMIRLIV